MLKFQLKNVLKMKFPTVKLTLQCSQIFLKAFALANIQILIPINISVAEATKFFFLNPIYYFQSRF